MFRYILITLFLLLVSCANNAESIPNETFVNLNVSFSGFNITSSPMTKADDDTTLPSEVNRCALKVLNESGVEVKSFSQKKRDTDFGDISMSLVAGKYTFVCVLNQAATDSDAPASITSATIAEIPGKSVRDIYCCSKVVDVSVDTKSVELSMGSRINSRFCLTITDVPPTNVKRIRVRIAPELSAPSSSLSINPSSGCINAERLYQGTRQITDYTAATPDIVFDLLLPQIPYNTTIQIDALGESDSQVFFSKTLTDVQFQPNRITHATGTIFSTTTGISFTFTSNEWSTYDFDF